MTGHDGGFFSFLTPAEIYRQLTGGQGTASLYYEHRETDTERIAEGERADLVRSLANVIKSGWQGAAGEGAYGAAMPLAERMLENSEKLDHAQDLLMRQIGSFNRAANSVQPVSSDPPSMSADEKFPFDVDHDKAVQDYQDSAQNNIVVYREYDGASHYNETNLPQEYHTVNRSGGDVSVEQPGEVIKVDEPEPRNGQPGDSGPISSGPYPGGGPGPGGYPGGPTGGPVGPSGGPAGPGSQTSPTDFRPEPPLSYPVPTYPSPGQSSPVSAAPGGFVGGYPSGGEFGPRGGGPGSSGGPGGGRGPGGGGPGSAVRGPLASGPGALAAQEAAAARRAAQAAAAGARPGGAGAMGAPMGAGRNKDDEDTEHHRKVLIEEDAEATFGSDILTAPQVIGDDEYEDD